MQFHGDDAVAVHHVDGRYVVLTFMSWSNWLSPLIFLPGLRFRL